MDPRPPTEPKSTRARDPPGTCGCVYQYLFFDLRSSNVLDGAPVVRTVVVEGSATVHIGHVSPWGLDDDSCMYSIDESKLEAVMGRVSGPVSFGAGQILRISHSGRGFKNYEVTDYDAETKQHGIRPVGRRYLDPQYLDLLRPDVIFFADDYPIESTDGWWTFQVYPKLPIEHAVRLTTMPL